MSHLRPNRILAGAGVRMCKGQEHGADNNRRGQDESAGPVGGYAVVVAWDFWLAANRRGAARQAKSLFPRAFLGTIASGQFS